MKHMTNEQNDIFQNLEEGIIVIKDRTVDFTNKIFIDILYKIQRIQKRTINNNENIMDFKIFRLRNEEDQSTKNKEVSFADGIS